MEDPDVILVTTMGDAEEIRDRALKDFTESEAWKSLRAVREGRLYFLPNDLFLYKPNSRFPEAFAALADRLYPGAR
jgi:iron complex transport system substrate-binding protein